MNRVDKKLKDRRSRCLLQAGKMVLIKLVTQAISNYIMGFFRLPHGVVDRLEAIMARF